MFTWFMDGPKECCGAPLHTSTGECDILAKCKLKPKLNEGLNPSENPIYECVTAMRCALIKKHCPDNWEVMIKMEQHTEQRKFEPFYPVNQVSMYIINLNIVCVYLLIYLWLH